MHEVRKVNLKDLDEGEGTRQKQGKKYQQGVKHETTSHTYGPIHFL